MAPRPAPDVAWPGPSLTFPGPSHRRLRLPVGPKPQRYKQPHQPSGQLTARFLARGTHTCCYGWGPRSIRSRAGAGGRPRGPVGTAGPPPNPGNTASPHSAPSVRLFLLPRSPRAEPVPVPPQGQAGRGAEDGLVHACHVSPPPSSFPGPPGWGGRRGGRPEETSLHCGLRLSPATAPLQPSSGPRGPGPGLLTPPLAPGPKPSPSRIPAAECEHRDPCVSVGPGGRARGWGAPWVGTAGNSPGGAAGRGAHLPAWPLILCPQVGQETRPWGVFQA